MIPLRWLVSNQRMRESKSRALPLGYTAIGASDGNRTHITSLEDWYSAIELHLHNTAALFKFKRSLKTPYEVLPHLELFPFLFGGKFLTQAGFDGFYTYRWKNQFIKNIAISPSLFLRIEGGPRNRHAAYIVTFLLLNDKGVVLGLRPLISIRL